MKKKILFIFLTLVMLLTILIVYLNNFFFPVQFKQIVIQKAEEFLKRGVSFDSIRFHPIKGIVITQLNISDKESLETPFLHADEVSFSVLYAPILRDKKIIIPQLTIEKPVVSLRRNSAGEWNFHDLLNFDQSQGRQDTTSSQTKSPLGFFLGGISIIDGDLTILDKSVEPSFLETLENVNLKVSLSISKGIKFSLETILPTNASTLKITGTCDFSLQKINAHLHTTNMKLAEYLAIYYKSEDLSFLNGTLKMAEVAFDRQGNLFHAKGQLEVNSLDLKMFPNQEFRGQIKIPELSLILDLGKRAEIRSSLEILSADIKLAEEKKFQGDFRTKNFYLTWQPDKTKIQGSFILNHAYLRLNEEQSLSGQIEAQDFSFLLNTDQKIDLTSNLMKVNNFSFQLNNQQSISGQLQLGPMTLVIQQGGIKGAADLQLANANVQLDQKKKLTGQMQASHCLLTATPDGKIDLTGNLKINELLLYLAEQQSVRGQLNLTPLVLTIQEKITTLKGNLLLSEADIQLGVDQRIQGNIEAADVIVSLEDKKIHFKTNTDILLDDVNILLADKAAAGNSKLNLDLTFNPNAQIPLMYEGSLTPKITVLSGIPVVQEVKNISGKIHFTTDQINVETLNLSALDTTIDLSGSLSNFSDPRLEINASTDKFDLEKIPLLAPEILQQMKIQPTGEAKISLRLKDKVNHLNAADIAQANMHATVLLKDTVLKGESLPSPVSGINGEIAYDPDTLSWRNLQAEFQDKDFFSNGQWNNFSSPEIQGTLSSKNLSLNLSTQVKLTDKTLGIDSLKGRFHNSSFDVAGEILLTGQREPLVDLKGQVKFDVKDLGVIQPALGKTLEAFRPEGIIHLEGNLKGALGDWRNWELSINAQSPKITIAGYTIQDIFLKADQSNQWVKHFDLTAEVYDGKLKTDGAVSLADQEMPLQINIDLQNASLQKFKETTIWKDQEVSGFLSGASHLRGPLTNWQALEGEGTVLIHDGNIWQLNLLKGLGRIIFTSDFENIPIQEVSADFNIQNQKVSTENLNLKSPVFTVAGKGWVNFQNQLDFNLNTQFEERLPSDTESYHERVTSLLTRFGSILNIRITGMLSDPKFTAVPAPGRILEKGIKLLFEGVKDAL